MAWILNINAVPLQAYVRPFTSLDVTNRGYRGVGTFKCRMVDKETAPGNGIYTVNVLNEHVIDLQDNSVKIFGGYVRKRTRTDFNAAGIRVWEIEGQDFSIDPTEDWVPVGTGPRTTVEKDKARIEWLFSTYGTRGVLAVAQATVQQVEPNDLLPMDFQMMTLAEALDAICAITGAQWYVDFNHILHYFKDEVTAAPFNIDVQAPNNTTTFPCKDFEYPDDTISYVNQVQVVGKGVTYTANRGGTAPPAGTRRLHILRDTNLLTVADCQKAGEAYLAAETNRQTGKLKVWRAGLRAGQLIHIKNTQWSLDTDLRITEVKPDFVDLNQAFYNVSFGTAPVKLSDMWNKTQGYINAVGSVANDAADIAVADAIAPVIPTGLYIITQMLQDPDGSLYPTITADWDTNIEPDMDVYECQLDKAIDGYVTFALSASGTGGTLAAGSYRVKVTGNGLKSGETASDPSAKTQVITAGQRLYVNITPKSGVSSYKVYAERVDDPRLSFSTSTTGSNVEVVAEATTGSVAPLTSSALSFLTPAVMRTSISAASFGAVQGGAFYGVRVRAIDKSGNFVGTGTPGSTYGPLGDGWPAIVTVTAPGDTSAPAIPDGLSAISGFRLAGLRWNRNSEIDIDKYELRWSTDLAGVPDPAAWTKIETRATTIVIQDLAPGTIYYFQVRAIDRSGNCQTAAGDPTAVKANSNPEAGWSNVSPNWVTAQPTNVGSADIAAGSIISDMISTGGLDAGVIKTGSLALGGTPNTPDFLIVYDSTGVEIGRWDQNGLVVKDPTNTDRMLRYMNGVLDFSSDGGVTWETSITADGIIADSITLGNAPGGHNAIPNASFEMSAFATTFSKVWTAAADWSATVAPASINLSAGVSALSMATTTY
jgi:hypothetical protein